MKLMLLLLILLVATNALAQSSDQKARSAENTKRRAAGIADKKIMSDVELRAAALTNFNARCATDFRWRDITNKIALQQKQIDAAKANHKELQERARLEYSARKLNTRNPEYVKNALAAQKAQEAAKANLELQKINIEADIKKMLSASVRQ